MADAPRRLPALFIPHGGGPWPFVEMGIPKTEVDALGGYLRTLPTVAGSGLRAIVCVTAHWEAPVVTVSTCEKPGMLYDYYGFPPAAYTVRWPAPGSVAVARRVEALLGQAGIPCATDAERGFDHGTFVPLAVAWPQADVPTVQLSLRAGLDPAEHLAVGRALAPLRDEGVLIVGSGMTFHNLRIFWDPRAIPLAEGFDAWLREAVTGSPERRDTTLTLWKQAPHAALVHPREEHLLPLMVVAGAAGSDVGRVAFNGTFARIRLSGFQFGQA